MNAGLHIVGVFLCVLLLSACGKKPGQPFPPQSNGANAEQQQQDAPRAYPQTYPASSTLIYEYQDESEYAE